MKEQVKLGAGDILSIPLRQAMAVAFSQKKQVLLFLNRRGYARTLVCEDCGKPVSCVNCSVGMTLHNNRRTGSQSLICHYCGYMINASEAQCSFCGCKHFTKAGFGTQQLETLLQEVFPHEKVLRMDQDTTVSPGAHREIIESFARKEASILIGTQMIAKGLDFPDCTVVGVLGADLMISASSYKASERAFQLITQAAGRAGRGDDPGKVFIQSYDPSNPLFRYACTQDYRAFYDTEIAYRQKMNLPPFKAIGEIVLSLEDESALQERGRDLYHYLSDFLSYQDKSYGFELYGPVPAVIYELRGRYRLSFIIKASNKSAINAVFRHVMDDFDHVRYPLSYDNDPTG
jgi:primosomal protein N' (replication factor Y)